ncbi:MAG: fimbrillin family protein [Bacteroidales bacterium]|nr:fimbrillin family protein [Bacteroidales bacterium]
MKKYLILAAFAAVGALMSSCQNEKDIEIPAQKSGEVSLVFGGIETRSMEQSAPIMVNTYDLGTTEAGEHLAFEETVTELGVLTDEVMETRGTPVYTENVTTVYGESFNGEIHGASGRVASDGAFEIFPLSGGRNAWRRELGFDPWVKAGGDVSFFLHMPATLTGASYYSPQYNNAAANGSCITIGQFKSPETASEQQDILLAVRNIDFETYKEEYQNGGAKVLFHHALTGVKFAIGNNTTQAGNRTPADEIQTFITKVEIKGLADQGQLRYQPYAVSGSTEIPANEDDPSEYSSAADNCMLWSRLRSNNVVFSQEFTDDDIIDFVSGSDDVNGPASFYNGGANRNLNKKDASLTFWFIPQEITDKLVVDVTIKVWGGSEMRDEQVITLNLGEKILEQVAAGKTTNQVWKAGQLRTFTLKPDLVDVEIHDKVSKFEKTDVVITNTGNVDAYIRAMIVANWWGKAGSENGIAMGYTSAEPTAFVPMWKMSGTSGDNYGGVFEGLPGTDWVLASDGYFYYKNKVAPSQETGDKLFIKYSLDTQAHPVPEIWYLDGAMKQYTNVSLKMEIPVQAIEAKEGSQWDTAWSAVLGYTVQ